MARGIQVVGCVITVTLLGAGAMIIASCARRPAAVEPPAVPAAPADTAAETPVPVPVPVPDTAVAPDTAPAPSAVRVCAGGDVMVGNNLDTLWAVRRGVPPLRDPMRLVAPLRPLVRDADVVLINVEGAIGEGPAPPKCRVGSRNCYAFRQPIEAARALASLADSGVVVGNVANNHAMDAGPQGFGATARHLGLAGVSVTGSDTLATPVPAPGGDTVAVLGFSTFQAGPDARDLAGVRRHVARAAARFPRVVVTMHMGAEGVDAQRTRDGRETFLGEDRGNVVAFARSAVDAGADLVIGHGPHVLRAAEWRGRALIAYSLGNLLTYGPFSMHEPLNRGAVLCAALDRDGAVTDVVLRATVQVPPGIVAPDPTGRGALLVDSLSRLDFPETGVRFMGEARAVEVPRE